MPGGFGVFPGGFGNNRSSGKATTATTTKKTPGKTPKPTGKLACVENLTRAISGGEPLIKCRDYKSNSLELIRIAEFIYVSIMGSHPWLTILLLPGLWACNIVLGIPKNSYEFLIVPRDSY